MRERHEDAAHPDDCNECRRMMAAGDGEAAWEHLEAARSTPEWRAAVWRRIGGRRTKWFDRRPEDRRY